MNESEFRSRLYKLFDNNFIYNNPLSDELDIILKALVENNYNINKLTYRELLRCFAIKTCILKLEVYPIVDFIKMPNNENALALFKRIGDKYYIVVNYGEIDSKNALFDMEKIFHEIQHMAQSLSGHDDPAFHYMLKDHLLIDYFGEKYYSKNYSGILFEMDAFQTAREEIYDYVENNIPLVFENFKNIEETKNNLDYYIYPDELCSYRIINRTFDNYKKYKNYYDIDQIFDEFMLDISNNQTNFLASNNFFDIHEMNISLGMQYDQDGKYKSVLEFIKSKNKYRKELEQLQNNLSEYENKDDEELELEKEYLQNLTLVYDSFIYSRSYNPAHIARELLSFSKYQGKDIKVLEDMYLTEEMFTDMVLYNGVAFEQDYNKFVINDEDLDYIDYCINQIHNNNTFITSDDEYFYKLKMDIYKNSVEILETLKSDMIERKKNSKIKRYLKE